MQDGGGVLELAILTHRRRLAVALRLRTGNPERRERAFAQQLAELLADIDQRAEILDISPRERIFDHRDSRRPAHRRIDRPAHLAACFLDDGHDFSHLALHRCPTWIPQRSSARKRGIVGLVETLRNPSAKMQLDGFRKASTHPTSSVPAFAGMSAEARFSSSITCVVPCKCNAAAMITPPATRSRARATRPASAWAISAEERSAPSLVTRRGPRSLSAAMSAAGRR